ncbi:MAG: hypothetical protein WC637_12630 [Victivallales bacterium]
MLGRQSQNEGISVLPAPGAVTVDGRVDDWDLSGRIWVFADIAVRDSFSVEISSMWDADALYIAARWHDPTPMQNNIDPDFNPNEGWKSDAMQLRVKTDQVLWLTTWYFTPKQMPVMHISKWKDPQNWRNGQDVAVLTASSNGTEVGRGVQMAYRQDDNRLRFVQEIKIPWKILYASPPKIEPGMTFQLGLELTWGDPSGTKMPVHRYSDNLQPGKTKREFFWSSKEIWGDARLLGQGKIPVRNYIEENSRLVGHIPIRLELPSNVKRFTLVIEDQKGRRVRNLGGDISPADYLLSEKEGKLLVEVQWDGLDDEGKAVAAGPYIVRGLYHEGLRAEYDLTYYNPGTPPWQTSESSSAWGSDHANPKLVAAGGERTFLAWGVSEGGSGLIGINSKGLKLWGERRGASALAADGKYVYAVSRPDADNAAIYRYAADNGSCQPFIENGTARPFELKLTQIIGDGAKGSVAGMTVQGKQIAIALNQEMGKIPVSHIGFLDAASAVSKGGIRLEGQITGIAYAPEGFLYVALKDHIIKLKPLDDGSEKTTLNTPGLESASGLTVDRDGNFLTYDNGNDKCIKAFSSDGKLAYSVGNKGGRPLRGLYDPKGIMNVQSLAIDGNGMIWAPEFSENPRRVSVWSQTRELMRDYVGGTGYAGTGSYLRESDAGKGYVGSMEMELDRNQRSYKVKRILWVPDPSRSEAFPLWRERHWYNNPVFVRSSASGVECEYLFYLGNYAKYAAFYMLRGEEWKPVSAITTVDELHRQIPQLSLEGHESAGVVFWNDLNEDGRVSIDECEFFSGVPALRAGWGTRPAGDLSLYFDGIVNYRPIRFTQKGAPVFGASGVRPMAVKERGDFFPVLEDGVLLVLSTKGMPKASTGILGVSPAGTEILWSYPNPYPSVSGSHLAVMPRPGLVIGPLKIMGVADVNSEVGRVFAIRGNLGQDFFFTTDGLYIGSLFQDCRLPSSAMPLTEDELAKTPLEMFSLGGEPFNGWFGRQPDGAFRLTTSLAREGVMIAKVNGLDSVKRLSRIKLEVNAKEVASAVKQNAKTAELKLYQITRTKNKPVIDGRNDDWTDVKAMHISREGSPLSADVSLSYDDTSLYLLFDVTDPSPWLNSGKEPFRLFKTGDAVDFQVSNRHGSRKDGQPVQGDLRIVFAKSDGKPVALLMQPVAPGAAPGLAHDYSSPVGVKHFDRVEVLRNAVVSTGFTDQGYVLEASIPLETIALKPVSGLEVPGDVGVIASDTAGIMNTARMYWANPNTNLVNDEPQESWLFPKEWGKFRFE